MLRLGRTWRVLIQTRCIRASSASVSAGAVAAYAILLLLMRRRFMNGVLKCRVLPPHFSAEAGLCRVAVPNTPATMFHRCVLDM